VKKAMSAMNYVKELLGDREIGLDINQIMGTSMDENDEEILKQQITDRLTSVYGSNHSDRGVSNKLSVTKDLDKNFRCKVGLFCKDKALNEYYLDRRHD
jgi:hypothetical protein